MKKGFHHNHPCSLNLGSLRQPIFSKHQSGVALFIVLVVMLILTMSAMTGAKSAMTMENISDNQLRKARSNYQAESLVQTVMNDNGYLVPLIQESRNSGNEVFDDTYRATLPGSGTREGSAAVTIKPRIIVGWSSSEISSLIIEISASAQVNNTRSEVSPTFQRIVVAE